MKGNKVRFRTYLPQELYVELRKRHLYDHLPFMLAFFLKEFLETGVYISWEEMPNSAKQKQYLEQKLREFFSGTLKGEYPQEEVLEKVKEESLTETGSSSPEVKKEEKKEEEEVKARDREEIEDEELRRKRKEEFLKRFDQFW
jgi:hypothetical protein